MQTLDVILSRHNTIENKQALQKALSVLGWLALSLEKPDDAFAYIGRNHKLCEEIAKELSLTKEEVVSALDAIVDPISLYEPIYHDGADAVFVMDQVKDEKNIDENWIEEISLREAMKRLSEREKLILRLRFFSGKTQMEVASEVGISQAQVSRLEKSALGHMKKYI